MSACISNLREYHPHGKLLALFAVRTVLGYGGRLVGHHMNIFSSEK